MEVTSVLSATSVVLVQASHLWPWGRAQHGGGALAAQLGDAESSRGRERRQAPASVAAVCYPCVRAACTGVSAGVTWLLSVLSLLGALGPCLWAHALSWFWREYRGHPSGCRQLWGVAPSSSRCPDITPSAVCPPWLTLLKRHQLNQLLFHFS